MEDNFTHERLISIVEAVFETEERRIPNRTKREGFGLICLISGGLLHVPVPKQRGYRRAPLCMRKPGLIQIFIRCGSDVFTGV